jgi:serine/threonine protein kinase
MSSLTASFEDPRLLEAVQEYLEALEGGRRPSRRDFLARHAEVADELAACLDGLALVHSAVSALRGPEPLGVVEGERLPASPLGDYRIVREIGRGGMGIVYEALQLSLGRPVALKVLPFAAALDRQHLQRFHNEAQAAARLHHPNIVPVYAVGCERGVHYYAMQLIEGQSLAALIGELRNDRDRGRPGGATPAVAGLSTQRSGDPPGFFRVVAHLAVQAAEALEHAHRMGVVHRDVKPANLLLDRHDNLWVTDFGLAQFQARTGLTRTGDLVGTLRYMSPEQARSQAVVLDQRTDVYSLGATLYELLTLEPAFAGSDPNDLLRRIVEEEPRPPCSLDRSIPVELETIVLKAMAKVPGERYATARELADDLERWLKDEPIRARRPTLREKVVKWARRHRSVTVSAAILLVLAAAGSLVGSVLLALEQAKTEAAYRREREQRTRAEKSFREARAAVDFFTRVSKEDLVGKPEVSDVRRKMLEAALGYYERFIEERQDDPTTQADLAQAEAEVKAILAELSALKVFCRVLAMTRLLGQKAVQEDLKLSGEQVARIARLKEGVPGPPSPREIRRLSPEQRRGTVQELTRAREEALAGILTARQHRRLRQLDLQTHGPFAFNDPDVVAELGLSAEQQQAVRLIQDEARVRSIRRALAGQPLAPEPPGSFWGTAHTEVLAQLTQRQRARWNEMLGEPLPGAIRWGTLGGLPMPVDLP